MHGVEHSSSILSSKRITLTKEFEHLYHGETGNVITELTIFLQDSPENCLERIHLRNRPYEQKIELELLERLSEDYEKLFTDWKRCPVVRLSVSDFDCTSNNDVGSLAKQIESYIAL